MVEFIEKNIELWLTEIIGQENGKLDLIGAEFLFFMIKKF